MLHYLRIALELLTIWTIASFLVVVGFVYLLRRNEEKEKDR